MSVLLVNPHETSQGGFSSAPLGLAYLAGTLTASGIDVKIIDGYLDGFEGIKKAIDEYRPEWVGITCYTPGRHNALLVARYAKEKGAKTVLGGAHPTIMWKQIKENYSFVDYCIQGEGEQTFLELVSGSTPVDMNRPNIASLDDIPFPAWRLLELNRYPGGSGRFREINLGECRVPVIFSRGCEARCAFCSTWWIWKGYRHRSPENMIAELEFLQHEFNVHHIVFQDDAMTLDVEAIKQLCRQIIDRGLRFGIFGTTRTDVCDQEMFDLMVEAGFYGVSMGVETGSQRMLNLMSKHNTVEQNEQAINMARKAGLTVSALIVKGYPGETEADRKLTEDFLNKTCPDDVGTLGETWVLPGTKLYRQMKNEGYISDDYWLNKEEVYKIKVN